MTIFLLLVLNNRARLLNTNYSKTSNPVTQEGLELAIELARKGVGYTQPSEEIRKKLRSKYAKDAESLTFASQVIAIHFQTVAAANNYWK